MLLVLRKYFSIIFSNFQSYHKSYFTLVDLLFDFTTFICYIRKVNKKLIVNKRFEFQIKYILLKVDLNIHLNEVYTLLTLKFLVQVGW